MKQLIIAVRVTLVFAVLTGVAYPLLVTGLARAIFPHQADGSLIQPGGKTVGSELIGQSFSAPKYFHSRPSAAGNGYDPLASGGSNFGPTSAKLQDRVKVDIERLRKQNPNAVGEVPVELVTTSGSGLDPHISPSAAVWQVPRVAAARGVGAARIQASLDEAGSGRDFGFLGDPTVNVLELNLALDRQFGQPPVAPPSAGTVAAP